MPTITPLQLRRAGFSEESISNWVEKQRPLLKKAGFSDMEINKEYGVLVNKSNLLVNGELDTDASLLEKENHAPFSNKIEQENKKKVKDSDKSELTINKEIDKNKEEKIKATEKTSKFDVPINDKLDELEALQSHTIGSMVSDQDVFLVADEKIKEIEKEHAERIAEDFDEGKHFKKEILHTEVTTGQESRKVLNHLKEHYGWSDLDAYTFNTFISFVSALESDNRNIYNKSGNAKGLFQFTEGSFVTALNRLVSVNKNIDPNYEEPEWVTNARKHKDATYLSPDQQRALTIANFYKIKRSERLNRDGTDSLIEAIAKGDVESMKKLYREYHHADYRMDVVAGKEEWRLADIPALDARIDDYFKYWGSTEMGYAFPKMATWPTWLGGDKVNNWLAHKLGGQGNQHAFKHGYSQSVIGLFDQYIQWNLDNPEATIQDKDDIIKEIFMYQHQTWPDEIISAASAMLADAPFFVAGCFAAGGAASLPTGGIPNPATPPACMAGAFVLPEVLRHVFSEGLKDGKVNDFNELMKHFMDAKTASVAGKMAIVGSVTGAAGSLVKAQLGKGLVLNPSKKSLVQGAVPTRLTKGYGVSEGKATAARLATEIAVMTELGARLNGQVPTIRDFTTTAVLIFGFHGSVQGTKRLIQIYKDWGLHPKDLNKIIEERPEAKDELLEGKIPSFFREHQEKLLAELEKTKNIKLLPPPKFQINERVNITMDGTKQATIVKSDVINGEPVFTVKMDSGELNIIRADQIRKVDPNEKISVNVLPDGKLDIVPVKVGDVKFKINDEIIISKKGDKGKIVGEGFINKTNERFFDVVTEKGNKYRINQELVRKLNTKPEMGSKDDNISFPEKQNSGEFSNEIVEITRDVVDKRWIINKDGTKYKVTENQALSDLSPVKEKIVSEDGKISTDKHLLIVNKFYPKLKAEFHKKTKKGKDKYETVNTFKTAQELIDKVFKGLTNKYKKISIVFAAKKGKESNIDILVGRINNKFTAFSRKAYETLIRFTENGVEKKAKIVALDKDRPLIFLHPETNKVIGMLMPRKFNKGDTLYEQAENYWRDFADQEGTGNFHYKKYNMRMDDEMGIPNEPYHANSIQEGAKADYHRWFDNANGLRYWDLVTMVETLLGKLPELKNRLRSDAMGLFTHRKDKFYDPNMPLKDQASLFVKRGLQEDPNLFLSTLAHELGHLIDYLPEPTLKKGTLLGHVAGIKKYLNQWIAGKNDGAKPLDPKELAELVKLAEVEAKKIIKETETEVKELKITPDKILKILNDPKVRDWMNPEFYDKFAKLSKELKLSVLKDALKGLISPHIKALVDKVNGLKVNKKLDAEASKIYAEMVQKEMKKRNIVTLEEVRAELKHVTHIWSGTTEGLSTKDIKYRYSNNELMAEFMMSWLLRPQWTKLNAPITFDLLKHHLKNRPEVEKLYFQIQNILNSSKDVRFAQMAEATKKMFFDGDRSVTEIMKKFAKYQKGEMTDQIMTEVVDVYHFLLSSLQFDGMKGRSPLAKDLRYYIDHHTYRQAQMSIYKRSIDAQIMKPLLKMGYNKHDLNYTGLLMNLVKSKQREGVITWKFYKMPPEFAERFKKEEGNLEDMLLDWSNQHPDLIKLVNKFFEVRREYVVNEIMKYDVYDAEAKQKILDNYEYITYQPLEYLIERFKKFGGHAWGTKDLKATLGTFEPILSPIDATIVKDLVLIGEMTRQNLYHHIVEFFKTHKVEIEKGKKINNEISYGIISKPKYIAKGKLDPIVPIGLKRVTYMRNGKLETYDIHKDVADAVQGNVHHYGQLVRFLNMFNTPARAILTEHNWLFWTWNWGFRDMQRGMIMLPSGKKVKIPYFTGKYLWNVLFKGLWHGAKDVLGEGTGLTKHLNKERFLIAPEEGFQSQAHMDSIKIKDRLIVDEDSVMLKKLVFEQYESKGLYRKLWDETVGKLLYANGRIGRILERSHKIAGYLTIKEQIKKGEIDMTERELMSFVQSKVGSPNFLSKGKSHHLLNNLYLFFNANKEGLRADIKGVKDDPVGVGGKFVAFNIIPKIWEKMFYMGMFGYGMTELYERVPEYDRNNFRIWIFGKTEDGRPIYWRFPLDFSGQMVTSMVSQGWDFYFGMHKHKSVEEKIDMFTQQIANPTPGIAPYITMMFEIWGSFQGRDITDRWGRPIIDPLLMKTDTSWEKSFELFKYFWNTYGVSYIHEFKMDGKKEISKEFEDVTGITIMDSMIERFIKVGDSSFELNYNKLKKVDQRIYDQRQWDLRKAINKITDGKIKELSESELKALIFTPNLKDNRYLLRTLAHMGETSGLLEALITADQREKVLIWKTIKIMLDKGIPIEYYKRKKKK